MENNFSNEIRRKLGYELTWNPTQKQLDKCKSEHLMLVVLVREQMSVAEFCSKYNMEPSECCVVYNIGNLEASYAESLIDRIMEKLHLDIRKSILMPRNV